MSVRILIGDVREQLAQLEPDSVDCVVTSPPYWGLRDYGVAGQIGMEPTWADHLAVMLDVFRAVRRVMKPSATLWLNYGDGYATHPNGRKASEMKAGRHDDRTFRDKPMSTIGGTFKPKDLLMMPNRLAIALQDDGWWVRAECIWGKPNPMPDSSGRFRPATAHEKIFMLAKSGAHYYDAVAVKKPVAESSKARYAQNVEAQEGSHRANAGGKTNGTMKAVGGPRTVSPKYDADTNGKARRLNGTNEGSTLRGIDRGKREHLKEDKQRGHSLRHAGFNDRWDHMTVEEQRANGRLLRNYEPEIWHIPPVGYDEAHFATFPPALAQRCIMAGCPAGGVVLDPFGGAGTTGMVAAQLGRSAILIEINPEYAALAQKRIEAAAQVRVDGAAKVVRQELPLFGEVA